MRLCSRRRKPSGQKSKGEDGTFRVHGLWRLVSTKLAISHEKSKFLSVMVAKRKKAMKKAAFVEKAAIVRGCKLGKYRIPMWLGLWRRVAAGMIRTIRKCRSMRLSSSLFGFRRAQRRLPLRRFGLAMRRKRPIFARTGAFAGSPFRRRRCRLRWSKFAAAGRCLHADGMARLRLVLPMHSAGRPMCSRRAAWCRGRAIRLSRLRP